MLAGFPFFGLVCHCCTSVYLPCFLQPGPECSVHWPTGLPECGNQVDGGSVSLGAAAQTLLLSFVFVTRRATFIGSKRLILFFYHLLRSCPYNFYLEQAAAQTHPHVFCLLVSLYCYNLSLYHKTSTSFILLLEVLEWHFIRSIIPASKSRFIFVLLCWYSLYERENIVFSVCLIVIF